ncbi:hypothetical protein H9Y04_05235 [Streptomyces sp. TRM66268-LWL]|uniref:Zinc ribbon domain-containing protein n=1 Tax=Streptomyces polyasparticus TaxID=2767826 RepID=A0ABR7SBH5_9ACTN|nr:hypothetical protein [Streptomyces polyasparticus]MBC9711972.1 hypothetical protein [Streptomyces polyasparticus]
MSARERTYRYVGPADLLALVRPERMGAAMRSSAELTAWVEDLPPTELTEPFTFVVTTDGLLRLAARRSEHVVCAGGQLVLAAGEMTFVAEPSSGRWSVVEVTNQSTGYCPDPASWTAVAAALDRAGIEHPGGWTHEVAFRRCEACQERSIVREDDYVCVFCGAQLPRRWNVDPDAAGQLP